MAYLSGDNDLEQTTEGYLQRLREVGSTARVNVVAQIDGRRHAADTRRVAVGSRDGTGERVWRLGEVDMGTVRAVADFVQWAKATLPARQYALIMVGHGSGVLDLPGDSAGAAVVLRGFGPDESAGDYLSVHQLGEALRLAHESAPGGTPGLDVVCLDACLTGAIEIAYELRSSARYLTCVEGILQHPGAPCERVLASLVAAPDLAPREFAIQYVREMGRFWDGRGDGTLRLVEESLVCSAIDLAAVGQAATALDGLAEALTRAMPDDAMAVTRARAEALAFGQMQQYRDIGSFADALGRSGSDAEVVQAALAVREALHQAIIATHSGPRSAERPSPASGLCVFFPPNLTRFPVEYGESSAFAADTRWGAFLEAYLQHMRGMFGAGTA